MLFARDCRRGRSMVGLSQIVSKLGKQILDEKGQLIAAYLDKKFLLRLSLRRGLSLLPPIDPSTICSNKRKRQHRQYCNIKCAYASGK